MTKKGYLQKLKQKQQDRKLATKAKVPAGRITSFSSDDFKKADDKKPEFQKQSDFDIFLDKVKTDIESHFNGRNFYYIL